ncbi:MAG: rhodanese-like domain-containing protein, partial [Anaerolineae bacterium]|nr:rhodanese-like domain-containing protein [Anaerolineae bacterium]
LIPMGEVTNRLDEIPKDKTVILTCRSGNRSGQVTDFLRNNGFDNVHNMTGGIVAWENAGLAVEQ